MRASGTPAYREIRMSYRRRRPADEEAFCPRALSGCILYSKNHAGKFLPVSPLKKGDPTEKNMRIFVFHMKNSIT